MQTAFGLQKALQLDKPDRMSCKAESYGRVHFSAGGSWPTVGLLIVRKEIVLFDRYVSLLLLEEGGGRAARRCLCCLCYSLLCLVMLLLLILLHMRACYALLHIAEGMGWTHRRSCQHTGLCHNQEGVGHVRPTKVSLLQVLVYLSTTLPRCIGNLTQRGGWDAVQGYLCCMKGTGVGIWALRLTRFQLETSSSACTSDGTDNSGIIARIAHSC